MKQSFAQGPEPTLGGYAYTEGGLGMVFGPKSDEIAYRWRELCSDDFHDLCTSLNVITTIKSERRRLSKAGDRHGRTGKYSQGHGWKTRR